MEMATTEGLIAMGAASVGSATTTLYGGMKPITGTNPMAFGIPARDGKSIILDFATASMSMGEIQKDFYAELPIKLRYKGSYHELGNFVSGIAALPRIVTLHDISIRPVNSSNPDELMLDVTAKTYRYLDEEAGEG